jgi:hypothetical protein
VAELDALQAEVEALKLLQAESAAELDALLPAVLDRAFRGELEAGSPTCERGIGKVNPPSPTRRAFRAEREHLVR